MEWLKEDCCKDFPPIDLNRDQQLSLRVLLRGGFRGKITGEDEELDISIESAQQKELFVAETYFIIGQMQTGIDFWHSR